MKTHTAAINPTNLHRVKGLQLNVRGKAPAGAGALNSSCFVLRVDCPLSHRPFTAKKPIHS